MGSKTSGNRTGAPRAPGAGRPRKYFTIERDQYLLLERQTIGSVDGTFHKPELVKVLSVEAGEIEMQVGNDIIVLRVPDTDEFDHTYDTSAAAHDPGSA